jgi:hypothetical protein
MNDLNFDPHQFHKPHTFPVHVEATPDGFKSTGLSYQDARATQIQTRAPKNSRWIPAFAANLEQLRHVLLVKAWRSLYNRVPMPSYLDWHSFCGKMAEGLKLSEDVPAHKKLESAHHVEAVRKAGGVLALYASIAYRSWLLHEDSVAVAESTHCSPSQVRQILRRLCEVATELGFETFPPHWTANTSRINHTAVIRRGGHVKKATSTTREKKKAGQESPALQTKL